MAHIEYWLRSFVIFRRSRPIILGNPIFFCDFQEGQDPPPPLDPHMNISNVIFFSDARFVCLFDLILYIPSKIFQLSRDQSSWV